MSVPDPSEEISLRVPAEPAYARIVRVGAAALALRQGMSFSEIDDLRLAVDEAMIMLLDRGGHDVPGVIDCVFRIDEGRLDLEISHDRDGAVTPEAVDRFDEIAAGLLDDYDLDPVRAWLRIRKLHAHAD
ncbi:MAG: ATP-binding protein [Acidimicrobiales bacterium]